MFGVEELTVKRDLRELRENGIDIHSVKGKGLGLFSKVTDSKLRELIKQYSALNTSDTFVDKSTNLFVTKLKEKSLANMVILQMCIDNKKTALIDYEKETDEMEHGQEISPLLIFQSDNYWRVLTLHNGKIKQYILNKIIDVRESNKHFTPIPKEKIEDVFKYSFRSWLGADTFKINFDSEHFAMVISPDDPKMANPFKTAIGDFNAEYYSNKTFDVSSNLYGISQQMILIKSFPDAKEAQTYIDNLKGDTKIYKGAIIKEAYSFFIISAKNVPLFFKKANASSYRAFYEEAYKTIFAPSK